ncbi:MAG: SDR family oxidoreductase [Candidatus Azobacteroides sp.]|nr:SDR family oxidoreductase [Candidatus Azobacteroides sp.]
MSKSKLADKVAVITGGNSGIGLATVRLFKEHGASVVIVGRNPKSLEKAKRELGENTLALQADVSKVDQIDDVMSQTKEVFGRIDVLFANAGVSDCPPIQKTEEAFFDFIMGINVKGVFFTFIRALPLLSRGASVIFTSSVANNRGSLGDPLYAATKAAVRSLARTLAADDEVLEKGIRVNCVSPGCIQTPLTVQDTPEMQAAINKYIESAVPMKRWGQPEDVAKAALYLACADSAYLTGSEIAVDGGLGQI